MNRREFPRSSRQAWPRPRWPFDPRSTPRLCKVRQAPRCTSVRKPGATRTPGQKRRHSRRSGGGEVRQCPHASRGHDHDSRRDAYALNERARFTNGPGYTEQARLTIRAASLPDDADWHPGRMPTFVHTMPMDATGRAGRISSAASPRACSWRRVMSPIQGLKMLGMPMVEHPKPGNLSHLPDRAL